MGPDRRETTLHGDSIEQKPDCQISLSAAISDNTSTVKPGVCASKILVSAPRFLMRRHRPTPGVREDGAQAARLLALGSAGDGAPGLLLISARPAHAAGSITLLVLPRHQSCSDPMLPSRGLRHPSPTAWDAHTEKSHQKTFSTLLTTAMTVTTS